MQVVLGRSYARTNLVEQRVLADEFAIGRGQHRQHVERTCTQRHSDPVAGQASVT